MRLIPSLGVVALLYTTGFVQIAEASKPLAPSRTRALCEKVLLATGLWRPQERAIVREDVPEAIYNERKFVVSVYSPHSGKSENFIRTNRDLFELRDFRFYPAPYLQSHNYRGLKVLDLACGDGLLVTELRRAGVDAQGVDVHLTPYQLSKPYYIKAAAAKTGLMSDTYDVVISTQGPLSYLDSEPEHQSAIFKEIHRILRVGGRVLVSPVNPNIVGLLPPGLIVKAQPDSDWLAKGAENQGYRRANYWLELEKVD